jgi:hypothetical protein
MRLDQHKLDLLARDVAGEIAFGNGAPVDRASLTMLDGMNATERALFRMRVLYHLDDFGAFPVGLVERRFGAVMLNVVPGSDRAVRTEFAMLNHNHDRGEWFRVSDDSYEQCTEALAFLSWGDAPRVEPEEVARHFADRILAKDGVDVVRDFPMREALVEQFGVGDMVFVQRDNAGVYRSREVFGGRSATKAFRDMSRDDMEGFIARMEIALREKDLSHGVPEIPQEERTELPLQFDRDTQLYFPNGDTLKPKSAFLDSDGHIFIHGHVSRNEPRSVVLRDVSLSELTSGTINKIHEAIGKSFSVFLIENPLLGKEVAAKINRSKGNKI